MNVEELLRAEHLGTEGADAFPKKFVYRGIYVVVVFFVAQFAVIDKTLAFFEKFFLSENIVLHLRFDQSVFGMYGYFSLDQVWNSVDTFLMTAAALNVALLPYGFV